MEAVEVLVRLAWLIGAAGFVIGLMQMNSPATARRGTTGFGSFGASRIMARALACALVCSRPRVS